MIGIKASDWLN